MRDWLSNLPEELTESDLIGMVEGTLPAEREAVAIAALKAEPRLGLMIKQMRADRETLGSLASTAPAPIEVGEHVLSVIDRRMIRELETASQQKAPQEQASPQRVSQQQASPQGSPLRIPVSQVVVREPSVFELLLQSRWMRHGAIAAGLLIACGAGVLGIRMSMKPATPGKASGARVAAVDPDSGPAKAHTPTPVPSSLEPELALSTTPNNAQPGPADDQPLVAISSSHGVVTDVPVAPETVEVVTNNDPAQPELAPLTTPIIEPIAVAVAADEMSIDAAAGLAREGRLGIVVLAPESATSSAGNDDLSGRVLAMSRSALGASVSCRAIVPEHVPAQVIALLAPAPGASVPASDPAGNSPGLAGNAGVVGTSPEAVPDMTLESLLPDAPAASSPSAHRAERTPPAVYFATLDPSARTLASLKSFLETGGEGEQAAGVQPRLTVRFRVLSTPIEQPLLLEPESILWWNAPAAKWAKSATVPIVVERR